jgi:hypothetical protein
MRLTRPLSLPLVFLSLHFAACGASEEPEPEAPVGEPTATGSHARVTMDRVKVQADLGAIRSALRTWKGMHEGEWPADLDTLGLNGLQYPDAYTYDAATGEVTCAELPDL